MNGSIGDRIKILRLKSKLTQEELVKKLGLNSKSSIANYESGYSVPSDDIKLKMCKVFNCSMDYLMGLTSEETKLNAENRLEQILVLANGLNIQEANYLIKQLNKAKIKIEKEGKNE